jgi:hypothetical protein
MLHLEQPKRTIFSGRFVAWNAVSIYLSLIERQTQTHIHPITHIKAKTHKHTQTHTPN